jgi:hypothetical protein
MLLIFLALRGEFKLKITYKWFSAFILFLLIGLPIYLRNFFLYGHPLGNTEAFSYYTGEVTGGIKERIYLLEFNLARFIYFFFLGDSPDSIKEFALVPLFDRFGPISGTILTDLHYLGVGYYGFVLVPTLLIVGIVLFVKNSSSISFNVTVLNTVLGRVLLIAGISLPIVLFLGSRAFTHAFSRYLFPVYALLIPLMIAGLHSISLKNLGSRKTKVTKALAALVAIWLFVFSTPVVFSSALKPILGDRSVFALSRQEESVLFVGIIRGNHAQELLGIYQRVDEISEVEGTLCLDIRQKFSAYPFLYKNTSTNVMWVNLDSAKQSGDMANKLDKCDILLTDNKDLKIELPQRYKNQEYFELSQIYLFSE